MFELLFDADKIIDPKLTNYDELAQRMFQWQSLHNPVFKDYLEKTKDARGGKFPRFLPVELFKDHRVSTGNEEPQLVFTSSATTGTVPSKHYIPDLSLYEKSFETAFSLFYGNPEGYCILALLPAYLERKGSSLVYMAERLVERSGHALSGFYLYDFERLFDTLIRLKASGQKTLLIGVTFALLDFAEQYKLDFPELIIMETGGMKGRREELTREEVHMQLKEAFAVPSVHSEYGMTELLSQAYAKGNGFFFCPPWMKVSITDPLDPFELVPAGKTGIINITDLANLHSCAFLRTSDLGGLSADGSFEVLGRMDHSETRGCSLMYP